jgi:hypothetical protein
MYTIFLHACRDYKICQIPSFDFGLVEFPVDLEGNDESCPLPKGDLRILAVA